MTGFKFFTWSNQRPSQSSKNCSSESQLSGNNDTLMENTDLSEEQSCLKLFLPNGDLMVEFISFMVQFESNIINLSASDFPNNWLSE